MYEYQVIPAPTRAPKIKGVKAAGDRFAHSLTELMNEAASQGWEYVRTDTLPMDEAKGITRKVTTSFQNLMVFRRALGGAEERAPQGQAAQRREPEAPAYRPEPQFEPHYEPEPVRQREPDPFRDLEPGPAEIVRQAPAPRPPSEEEMRLRADSLRPAPIVSPAAAPAAGRAQRAAPPPLRPLGGVRPDDR